MPNPTSLDGHPARLATAITVQNVILNGDRSYTLVHERVAANGQPDLNDIWCLASGNTGVLNTLSGSGDMFRVTTQTAVEIGPTFGTLSFVAAGGSPLLAIYPSQRYLGRH